MRRPALLIALVIVGLIGLVGTVSVQQVRRAGAEVTRLSERNVARLTVMGEMRGQQARINHGVAEGFAPDADELKLIDAHSDMSAAVQEFDRLMTRYQALTAGTSAEQGCAELLAVWRLFRAGVHVHFLDRAAEPGIATPEPWQLGGLVLELTDRLDIMAGLEQDDARAIAAESRQAHRTTTTRAVFALLMGLLLAGGVAILGARSESARRRAEARFRALVQESADVLCVVDAGGHFSYVSPSAAPILGYDPADMVGGFYADHVHPDDGAKVMSMTATLLNSHAEEHRIEARIRHADGDWRWHEVVVRNLLNDPAVRGYVVNHRDISERRRFQDRLAHDATHDTLTGLANRAAFLTELDDALADAIRNDHRTAVMFIDLNDFKQVNDTWGHETGDGLLVAVGRALDRSVLGADTVARLGGDEFGIVLRDVDSPMAAHGAARRIVAALADPLDAAGRPLHAKASIGIAVSGHDCTDAEELLRRADLAMYDVKRRKTNDWLVYSTGLTADEPSAGPTTSELRKAIENDELRLQYQPIVDMGSGELLGVEALVRWQHPTRGLLGPGAFIPLAESSGLVVPLGAWVLAHACAQVGRWQRHGGGRRLYLSANFSARHLDQPGLVDQVLDVLDRTGFDSHSLILEITEEAIVNDDRAVPVLTELRSHGIRVAVDDFGTGYSSLRYLTKLPVDVLKLDRCFVAELDGTAEGSAVAEAVIRLSQALNLVTIAEGIETAEQVTELALLGYELAQGFHYARPQDPAAIEELLDVTGPAFAATADSAGSVDRAAA